MSTYLRSDYLKIGCLGVHCVRLTLSIHGHIFAPYFQKQSGLACMGGQ